MSWISNVRILLEILHQKENSHCMECPEETWPCRTIRLLRVGLDLDEQGMRVDVHKSA